MQEKTKDWSLAEVGSQQNKTIVITGTGGIGYECALALSMAGASIILAGRNSSKGATALESIRNAAPQANIIFQHLDLANLDSVREFGERVAAKILKIDVLINNAAVMAIPKRRYTTDGFEMQFGTNHLGHFALTASLLPLLLKADKPVVTTTSSSAHRRGVINFDDLQSEQRYSPWGAYSQSKLANLLFAFELQRHSMTNRWPLVSNAAHPGYAHTEIISNGPGKDSAFAKLSNLMRPYLGHSAAAGALPVLYAAISPEASPGGYYGPNGFFEMKGAPAKAFVSKRAKDEETAKRLWQISEMLVNLKYPVM